MTKIKLVIILIIRNIKWLFIKITSENKEIIKEINGSKMVLLTSKKGMDIKEDSIYKQLALDGQREFEATKIIKQIIKPGYKIFELGANVGYYALLEAKLIGESGKIYAVEPEKNNFTILKKNIELNRLKNIKVDNIAISDKDGQYPLYVTANSNLHSMIKPKSGDYREEMVVTKSVDSYLAEKGGINYLRMDIEGYEFQALQGMDNTLKNNPGLKLFIELHAHLMKTKQTIAILQKLKSFGFEIIYTITHDNYLRSVLGEVTVEQIKIDDLCKDPRITGRQCAFETFFEKIN